MHEDPTDTQPLIEYTDLLSASKWAKLNVHAAAQEVEYFEKPFAFLSLGERPPTDPSSTVSSVCHCCPKHNKDTLSSLACAP